MHKIKNDFFLCFSWVAASTESVDLIDLMDVADLGRIQRKSAELGVRTAIIFFIDVDSDHF